MVRKRQRRKNGGVFVSSEGKKGRECLASVKGERMEVYSFRGKGRRHGMVRKSKGSEKEGKWFWRSRREQEKYKEGKEGRMKED